MLLIEAGLWGMGIGIRMRMRLGMEALKAGHGC